MRRALEEADESGERGRSGEAIGEPHERDRLHPGPEHRDRLARVVEAEIPRAQRPQAMGQRRASAPIVALCAGRKAAWSTTYIGTFSPGDRFIVERSVRAALTISFTAAISFSAPRSSFSSCGSGKGATMMLSPVAPASGATFC